MKESNFYSDEFEQLIREKTEQYKMYPSEKVWKGVHNSLHTKRRWFIGTMSLLVGGILYFSGRELIAPSTHPVLSMRVIKASNLGADVSGTTAPERFPHTPLAVFRSSTNNTAAVRHNETTDVITAEVQDQAYHGITITLSNLVISQPDLSEFLSHAVKLPDHAPALPVIAARPATAAPNPATDENGVARTGIGPDNGVGRTVRGIEEADVLESLSARGMQEARNSRPNRPLAGTKPGSHSLVAGALPDSATGATQASATAIAEAVDHGRINWLHDYAMYILPTPVRQPRTYLQLTLSPTVNYRTLTGGDYGPGKFIPNAPVALTHPGDAQRYVDHSPALGFQVGGSVLYRVTRNLSVKGGLQFNFSRYKINAYTSNTPQQATIALSSYYGYIIDSLTSYTRIGNFGGRTQESFNNDYYQLSAPVGFELRILGNERLQLNIGATIQPSYLLNTNSYMLTSDYTGYTKEPTLFRRWNVSGGLEAFLTYKVGGIRLQAGPEFRYQLLSTYNSQYPISENLKGYGFKLGIVKELP